MYKKIMVPLDGSKLAESVFPHLETVTKGCKARPEVIVVQAVEPISVPVGQELSQLSSIEDVKKFETHLKTDADRYLAGVVGRLEASGVKARAEVVYGKAAGALIEFAAKNSVDLIVMATHGRTGISRWMMGSVADRLIRSAGVPVLMVRVLGSAAPPVNVK